MDAFSAAAVGPNGRLAYVRASASIDLGWPLVPRYHELVLATLANPQRAAVVHLRRAELVRLGVELAF